MTHLNELLSAYLDGELTTDEQSAVVAHLAECTACRGEFADVDSARTAMRSLPVLEAPAVRVESAMADVQSIEPVRRKRARTWWAAAAAAVVIIAGVGVVQSSADSGDVIDVPAAVEQHVARVSVDPGLRPVQVVSVVNQP